MLLLLTHFCFFFRGFHFAATRQSGPVFLLLETRPREKFSFILCEIIVDESRWILEKKKKFLKFFQNCGATRDLYQMLTKYEPICGWLTEKVYVPCSELFDREAQTARTGQV